MMATPLSMMALGNKPLAMGDRIWREDTGDPGKVIQGAPHLSHTKPSPSLKKTSQEAFLRALNLEGKKSWFGGFKD